VLRGTLLARGCGFLVVFVARRRVEWGVIVWMVCEGLSPRFFFLVQHWFGVDLPSLPAVPCRQFLSFSWAFSPSGFFLDPVKSDFFLELRKVGLTLRPRFFPCHVFS